MDFTPHHKNRRGLKNQAEYLRRQKQQRRNNLTLRFILPVCGALFPSPTHISDASHAITRSLSPFVPPPASPSLSNSSFLFPASPAQHDPSLLFLPPRGSTPFHPLNAYFRPATPQPFYFVAELDLSASNLPQWAPANGKLFLPVFSYGSAAGCSRQPRLSSSRGMFSLLRFFWPNALNIFILFFILQGTA